MLLFFILSNTSTGGGAKSQDFRTSGSHKICLCPANNLETRFWPVTTYPSHYLMADFHHSIVDLWLLSAQKKRRGDKNRSKTRPSTGGKITVADEIRASSKIGHLIRVFQYLLDGIGWAKSCTSRHHSKRVVLLNFD